MRKLILLALAFTGFLSPLAAQQACFSYEYKENELQANPSLRINAALVEEFIKNKQEQSVQHRGDGLVVITIPVVVHVLYNQVSQNLTDEAVAKQITLLNQCFRRTNADTANTPARFKELAADCEIEFKLAITDPRRRATSGIVRRYTPVTKWQEDDQMKFTIKGGDDAWDSKNYLNIWVCSLVKTLGYASFPGGAAEKDGIVLNFSAFGLKTVVHEAGHWFGLKHIWGDTYCGDDLVDDTPKQGNFTGGCPSGIRSSCTNGVNGDMYMNYMDLTSDACINLFTNGQKERMMTLFKSGGSRASLLTSYALQPPLVSEIPVDEEMPEWFAPRLYPNPAIDEITIDVSYDIRWTGKTIRIVDLQGVSLVTATVDKKIMKINISKLKPGIYFISAKKEDGSTIKQKLIKL
ncbi:MAG: T9SS type A sorting domain-containing protein [Chitinophagaceae bacterium]